LNLSAILGTLLRFVGLALTRAAMDSARFIGELLSPGPPLGALFTDDLAHANPCRLARDDSLWFYREVAERVIARAGGANSLTRAESLALLQDAIRAVSAGVCESSTGRLEMAARALRRRVVIGQLR
jgi:hypothetical protein